MSENESSLHVSRVNQLDAETLDSELFNILKKSLTNGFQILNNRLLISLEPEINALLRILLWKFTVSANSSTIGQRLLNLKYIEANNNVLSTKRNVYLAFSQIGLGWLNERLLVAGAITTQLPESQRNRFLKWTETLRIVLKMSSVANFLLFLNGGVYRTLQERFLGVRSGNASAQTIRQVQYEYMNRELLWHGFADFITFVLPLINVHRVKNAISRFLWSSSNSMISRTDLEKRSGNQSEPEGGAVTHSQLDFSKCVFCHQNPILPHGIGCQHVFCYYCIASNMKADKRYVCPICQTSATNHENIKPISIF